MTISAQQSAFLSIAQVAAALGCSQATVRRRTRTGEIQAYRLGGPGTTLRVDRREFEAWLVQAAVGPRVKEER